MAGQRRLNGHLCRFQIADLANHDDIRVLPQQGAYSGRETDLDVVLYLHLIESRFDHFDRIFDRADVDLIRRKLLERRVEGRRLTGARWPGDEYDSVGGSGHLLPVLEVLPN